MENFAKDGDVTLPFPAKYLRGNSIPNEVNFRALPEYTDKCIKFLGLEGVTTNDMILKCERLSDIEFNAGLFHAYRQCGGDTLIINCSLDFGIDGHATAIIVDRQRKEIYFIDPHVYNLTWIRRIESQIRQSVPDGYTFFTGSDLLGIFGKIQGFDNMCASWDLLCKITIALNLSRGQSSCRAALECISRNRTRYLGAFLGYLVSECEFFANVMKEEILAVGYLMISIESRNSAAPFRSRRVVNKLLSEIGKLRLCERQKLLTSLLFEQITKPIVSINCVIKEDLCLSTFSRVTLKLFSLVV